MPDIIAGKDLNLFQMIEIYMALVLRGERLREIGEQDSAVFLETTARVILESIKKNQKD